MGLLEMGDTWARRLVAALDQTGNGRTVRVLTYGFTALWPLVLDSNFVPDGEAWIAVVGFGVFLVAFATSAMLLRHGDAAEHDEAAVELARVRAGLGPVSASLAGVFEDIACQLDRDANKRRGLNEDPCKTMCIALLARTKALATLALGGDADGQRLRATLAVPLRDRDGAVTHLRVWCYDTTYSDRRFTEMEIGWDGAPEAFRNRATAIIKDLNELDTPAAKEGRSFRSVVCYPIRPRRIGSLEPLGVVSIDAEGADFFTLDRQSRLNTYIQPSVQALGIPLVSRYSNARFRFGA